MFENFIGNSDLKELIQCATASGRFPHAFIIEGEEGSGRHTFAKMIAAAAVCKQENAPCGTCRECELVKKDGFCDVLTYRPDGATFKVDLVRSIRDGAFVFPIEAKRKVNILLDCDKMNESAQNAFLKILEEPPAFMIFILVCRNASALLPTVRSRCVTLSIKNPDFDDAFNYLTLKTGRDEGEIKEALETSHGNIGKALEILDGSVSGAAAAAKEFFDAFKKGDRLSAVKLMQKFEKDRPGFTVFLDESDIIFKRALKDLGLNGDSALKQKNLVRAADLIEKYRLRVKRHVGAPLSLPILCTSLIAEIFVDL